MTTYTNSAINKKIVSLVIPLYNEAENIKKSVSTLLTVFQREGINYELVLVDNGSRDTTGELISEYARENPRIRKCVVKENQGYGWGIIKGLEMAKGDYLGFMCGDGQIIPEDVAKTINKLLNENLDLCKIRRVYREDGLKRKLVSSIYNMLFKIAFHFNFSDINGTPKIFTREVYNKLKPVSKDWFIDAEIMLKCTEMRYKIGELPVIFYKRKVGKSNVGLSTITEFIKNTLKYLLKGKRFT